MPRKARIDTPGPLHHIIVRGIERRSIFYDDLDRENFLERIGIVLTESDTPCFAWALIPNTAQKKAARKGYREYVEKGISDGRLRCNGFLVGSPLSIVLGTATGGALKIWVIL